MKEMFATLFIAAQANALDYEAAIEKAVAEKPMALAVVVKDIRLPFGMDNVEQRREVEDDIVTTVSQAMLSSFQDVQGFDLVDRRAADVILNEYVFQAHGFTRQVDAEKIGSFTNATHLLILSIAHQKGKTYRVHAKVVTVREAKILSAEKFDITAGAMSRRLREVRPEPEPARRPAVATGATREKTPWFIKVLVIAIGVFGGGQVIRGNG